MDWVDPDLEIPPGGFRSWSRNRRLLSGSEDENGRSRTGPYERVRLEEV